MPEVRFDIVSGAFAIIATERAKRPSDWKAAQKPPAALSEKDPSCPFCPDNEAKTPPEISSVRDKGGPDEPGWRIRVVPNKFPALVDPGSLPPDEREIPTLPELVPEELDTAMYWEAPGIGAHEVVIEGTSHDGTFGTYTPAHLSDVLRVIKERTLVLYDRKEIKYVHVFKNFGERAGASLSHPHFQIIALPVVPTTIANEAERQKEYEAKTGRCLFCDLVEREIEKDVRVVWKTPDFAVLCPFASRYSYETMIVPRKHISSFAEAGDSLLGSLAESFVELFGCYESMFSSLAYNLVFHGMPKDARGSRGRPYHAHVHIYPRLNMEAGLELGTGVHINPSPPEVAAREFISAVHKEGSGHA